MTSASDAPGESWSAEGAVRNLSAHQSGQLTRLRDLLLAANAQVNLTAVREPSAVEKLHFADSLALLDAEPSLASAKAAADLGSGAGFPLFPLAISLPDCRWIAIESVGKKCAFIRGAARELGLGNVEALHERAEDLGKADGGTLRASLDVVTARAVGLTSALCECGLPLLKAGGILLMHKTESSLKELAGAESVLQQLGGELLPEYRYRLEGDQQNRIVVRIKKIAETPSCYPRAAGVPFKKPLFGG